MDAVSANPGVAAVLRLGRRLSLTSLALAAAAGAAPPVSGAAPVGNPEPVCGGPVGARVIGLTESLTTTGIPLAGKTVRIDATRVKFRVMTRERDGTCAAQLVSVPLGNYRWDLAGVPTGASASIGAAAPRVANVNLGRTGRYLVSFVACPRAGCSATMTIDGHSTLVALPRRTLTVAIDAVASFQLRPSDAPLLPRLEAGTGRRYSEASRLSLCAGGASETNFVPQWVTPGPYNSSPSRKFTLVEGKVVASKSPVTDLFINHYDKDWEWEIEPDPPYGYLSHPTAGTDMPVEWEKPQIPPKFRPTMGDRASTIGYYIFDCGHPPFRSEIHPPIGQLTSRSRPVTIPTSFHPPGFPNGFGSNVRVPGIVSDIWFNPNGGKLTDMCEGIINGILPALSLFGPPRAKTEDGVVNYTAGDCIQQPNGPSGKVTMRIYMPKDPARIARGIGMTVPDVPLYINVGAVPGFDIQFGEAPVTTEVKRQGDATWIEVSIWSGLEQTTSLRITAAWAYPSPDNWGAHRWRVNLKDMDVDESNDFIGLGDWTMFANVNNAEHEWTEILSGYNNVMGGANFKLNASTNDVAPPSCSDWLATHQGGDGAFTPCPYPVWLGPDPVLFRGQRLLVYTHGYDSDLLEDDPVATALSLREPRANSNLKISAVGGPDSATYDLNYSVSDLGAIESPSLTAAAKSLSDAFTLNSAANCNQSASQGRTRGPAAIVTPPAIDTCLPPVLNPFLSDDWNPEASRQGLGKVVDLAETAPYEREEEPFLAPNMLWPLINNLQRAGRTREAGQLVDGLRNRLAAVPVVLRSHYASLVSEIQRRLPRTLAARAIPSGWSTTGGGPIGPPGPLSP